MRWEFDQADAQVHLHATAVERPARIVFDWDAAGDGFKTVTFDLKAGADDSATRVSVTESSFSEDEDGGALAVQQAAGWSEFLCYLKARLQFDIELRAGRTRPERLSPDPGRDPLPVVRKNGRAVLARVESDCRHAGTGT